VLFVGRLQPRKRVDLLIRACSALPAAQKPELWIVGDGPEKEMLMALARQVYPAAKFFGALYGKELVPAFTGADLFVLPGTGGLAVQEAMTYGLPVMVAEADGTREELVRPENGWLLPPGDAHALLSLLKEALSDPQKLRRMGEESFRIVTEEINIENMVSIFQSAINSVWVK
jgi:glycosyltransferase involved in cell wall biosynthesis